MCILIEIRIKIYFINVAAGNGPTVHSARDPTTHRWHAHETSTRTHARDNTHTVHTRLRRANTLVNAHTSAAHAHETSMQRTLVNAHTRRRRARTLVRIRTRHAHTRDVHATHAREHTRRPRANASTHARWGRRLDESLLHDGHA